MGVGLSKAKLTETDISTNIYCTQDIIFSVASCFLLCDELDYYCLDYHSFKNIKRMFGIKM